MPKRKDLSKQLRLSLVVDETQLPIKRRRRPSIPDRRSERLIPMPPGSVFGAWTVLGRSDPPTRYGGNVSYYSCKCRCGHIADLNGSHLRNGNTTICLKCHQAKPHNRLRIYEGLFNRTRYCALKGNNSRKKYHAFSLTFDEFLSLIETGKCHYCWTPLEWIRFGTGRQCPSGRPGMTSHQMDRKDNNLGYVPGNVVACCWRCNRAKLNIFTYEDYYEMTACLRKRRGAAFLV